jgi:hypothetical protein
VEEGIIPETITGTAYKNGGQSAGIVSKRRHCYWPYQDIYSGTGDHKDPGSWECVLIGLMTPMSWNTQWIDAEVVVTVLITR